MYYRIDSQKVVYETFDEEVVLINFETGNYYSINETGRMVWSLLENGWNTENVPEIIGRFLGSHHESGRIREAVAAFCQRLEKEGLLAESEGNGSENPAMPELTEPADWSLPEVEVFEEMQNLLLLDPIHDVDQSGWPVDPR